LLLHLAAGVDCVIQLFDSHVEVAKDQLLFVTFNSVIPDDAFASQREADTEGDLIALTLAEFRAKLHDCIRPGTNQVVELNGRENDGKEFFRPSLPGQGVIGCELSLRGHW